MDPGDAEIRTQADGFQEFAEGVAVVPGLLQQSALDVVRVGRLRICVYGRFDLLPCLVPAVQ